MIRFRLLLYISLGLGTVALCAKSALVLPPPAKCSRLQLSRWLVAHDLKTVSPAIKLQLVDRLQSELMMGWRVDAASNMLPIDQKNRVVANVKELKYVWFVSRCTEFADLSDSYRMPFLDEQIAFARHLQSLNPDSEKASLSDEIDGWLARVPDGKRAMVERTVNTAFLRWLQTESIAPLPDSGIVQLAERIANHLDRYNESAGTAGPIVTADSDDEIWRANTDRLMRAWFQQQADEYSQQPAAARADYAANFIQRIQSWDVHAFLPEGGSASSLGVLAARANDWKTLASDDEAERMGRFLSEIRRTFVATFIRQGKALFQ